SAKKRFPELDELCAGYIQNQFDAEKNAARCIDSLAEPTALTISRIAELLSDDETDRRVLADFGYYLGRWIYLIDALDDLGRDVRSGSVNPIVDKFRLTRDDIETKSGVCRAACEYADEAMNACVSRAAAAYELLDLSDYKPILDNIMYLGLANSQHGVLEKSKG
ncbi:MAG: DUF5685 family protein, partial [Oscillospiraceae bacterium]|nr:DUF5685 family protein [Oscillospiraceae bacterium]